MLFNYISYLQPLEEGIAGNIHVQLFKILTSVSGEDGIDGWLRMGLLPPPREFRRHILSCRELKAESFKRCLHSVLRGVSL